MRQQSVDVNDLSNLANGLMTAICAPCNLLSVYFSAFRDQIASSTLNYRDSFTFNHES